MPPHEVYIESHLGGGSVMRNKKPAVKNIGIDIDPSVIELWKREYSEYCDLVEADAVTYLKKYKFTGNELVYADPPYLPETRKRRHIYSFEYSDSDHEILLSLISSIPCPVIISGYNSELYNDVLEQWSKKTFNSKTHIDVREECLWFNFKPTAKLHDTRYLGSTFRERQNVKRRLSRFKQKVEQLDPIERHELLQWMNGTYK
jgi:site-specific DNA-adenine methylase